MGKKSKSLTWRCARCLRRPPYAQRHGQRPTCVRCHDELSARGLKWCAVCARALPLAAFASSGKAGSLQRRGTCRACERPRRRVIVAAAQRRWRQRHPEHQRAYKQAYMAKNLERGRRWAHTSYLRRKLRILRGER